MGPYAPTLCGSKKYFGAILKKSPPGSGLPSTIRPDALHPRLEKALAHLEAQDTTFAPIFNEIRSPCLTPP